MTKGRFNNRSTRGVKTSAKSLRSSYSSPRYKLSSFQDFRLFEPEVTNDKYPRIFPQSLTRIPKPRLRVFVSGRPLAMPKMFKAVSTGLAFTSPSSRVVLCARRAVRKSVLHALKKTGRAGQRKPRYNINSSIHC